MWEGWPGTVLWFGLNVKGMRMVWEATGMRVRLFFVRIKVLSECYQTRDRMGARRSDDEGSLTDF